LRSGFYVGASALALGVTLALAARAGAEPPAWYGTPKIVGTAQVGAPLTGDVGSITCQPECEVGREWLSCSAASAGGVDAPEQSDPNHRGPGCEVRWASPAPERFVPGPEDRGRFIQFHVIAKNMACDEEDVCVDVHVHGYSPTIGPVAAAPVPPSSIARPQNTAPPTIAGNAEDMQTLSAEPGAWSGTVPISFGYQWLRCTSAAADCRAIEGAVGAKYKVRRGDIGSRIAVTVTATNRIGPTSLTSEVTAPVGRARPHPGHDVLDVDELLPGDGLLVKAVEGPRIVHSQTGVLLRVTVSDRRGFLVDGATVKASAGGGAVLSVTELTGTRGVAYLELRLGPRVTAPRRIALTITASKPGVRSLRATKRIVLRVVAL
jgi:hypothetical protein